MRCVWTVLTIALVGRTMRAAGLAAALLVLLAQATDAHGQEITGSLQGRIVGEEGQPLTGVGITARSSNLPGERIAETDSRGHFRVLALPAGTYNVRLNRIGYRPVVLENVPVRMGKTTPLGTIQMEVQPVEVSPLVVEADRPIIDLTKTTLGATLESQVFTTLPTGREYLSIATLLPQVNVSFYGDGLNIAGSTGFDNAYFIDGINVTEPFRANGGTNLPYNFIDQIEVKTGGYEAEWGRALGGIVNVVTHSGGNEHRGSVFGFLTNSSLASTRNRGFLDLGTGDFTEYDLGLTLGGPIVRDRLWYFAAYDGVVKEEDLRLPGDIGVLRDQALSHQFAGKLTWQVTPKSDLVLTVVGDPTSRDLVGNAFHAPTAPPDSLANPDPFLADWREGGVTVALRGKHIVGQNFLLEGALGRTQTWIETEGATERGRTEILFKDAISGVWSGGHGNAWNHRSTRTSGYLTSTYYFGDNSLKAGFQFEYNFLDEDWRWLSNGPDSAGHLTKRSEFFYAVLPLDFQTEVRNSVASLFAQSSFLLHPRLRLNAGLRWDGQYFKGLTTGLDGSITDQFQPRLGFVLYPGNRESQKVTGSYARYYEQLPNLPVSFYYGGLEQDLIRYDHNPLDDPSGGITVHFVNRAADDLKGQHYDEFTLGYEQVVWDRLKLGVAGIYRAIREIISGVSFPETPGTILILAGNPGRGRLDFMPEPQHDYAALELSIERLGAGPLNLAASYVYSRTNGNYTGLFDQDRAVSNPNAGSNFTDTLALKNGTGRLPNDRPHVFKAFGSYQFGFGLTVGSFFTWQSGTPLNELGANPPVNFVFLQPRGTAGRTPSIWDLNLHLAYDLTRATTLPFGSRLKLDVLHLFGAERPVVIEQRRFLDIEIVDGERIQTSPNPNYLRPLTFQPPMTARLGVELFF